MNHRSHLLLAVGLLFSCLITTAQNSVGIGTETPNGNAVLHLVSPDGNQGFLVPQITTTQRTATSFTDNLTTLDQGLLVFDTDESSFYYWSGSAWISLSAQMLTAGTGLSISGTTIANSGDLDSTNEIQDLSLSGDNLIITGNTGATTIDLSPYRDNTDDQTATEVTVTPSGNLTSTNVQDALSEIQGEIDGINLSGGDNQTLSFDVTTLAIQNGNSVDLASLIDDADADATNEIQDLTFDRNVLGISGSESTVDLSGFLDNTDEQTLSFDGTNLALTDGGSVDLSPLSDGTGTDSQSLTFTGTSLTISGGNTVNLSSLQDGIGTDDQTATEVAVTAGNGMTSTNAQAALAEHQGDINSHTSSISSLGSRVTALENEKQDFLYLSASDFMPIYSINDTDARYIENAVLMVTAEANTQGQLKAKVELPNGAVIKSLEGYGGASGNTSIDATITLYVLDFGDSKLEPIPLGSDIIPAKSGAFQQFGFSVDREVDASTQMYYVIFQGQGGPAADYTQLNYIRIDYTY